MEKNYSFLKFLSQVFLTYGITTCLLNIFCILFGMSAREISTLFALGNSGVSISTSFQFLLVTFIINGLRYIFMTDILIRHMPLTARIITMFAGTFGTIVIFNFLFGWFPTDMPIAWIMFIVCFVISCLISTIISILWEKQENRRLDEALKRCKEE